MSRLKLRESEFCDEFRTSRIASRPDVTAGLATVSPSSSARWTARVAEAVGYIGHGDLQLSVQPKISSDGRISRTHRLILGSDLEYHRWLDGLTAGEKNSIVSPRINIENRQALTFHDAHP